MSAADLTAETMRDFQDSGAEKHTTIFLGAGASTTSGLPDWDTFVKRLLVDSKAVPNHELASLLLARQDPLLAVESARISEPEKWRHNVRIALYRGVDQMEPSLLHRAVAAHFIGGNMEDTSLATLNFDPLLEQAIADETGSMATSMVGLDTDVGNNAVHHLHGVVTPSEITEVVLSLTEFTDVIADPDAWQLSYLKDALKRGALIIAGTSYRDPDIRQWLHHALAENGLRHSALVLLARQGFSLRKDDFDNVKGALSAQWRAIGMKAVLLEDHADAAQIIQELRHLHAPSYLAPQERVSQIWKYHDLNFQTLQESYVGILARDAAGLKDAMNTGSLGLTLWLADGQGKLARWAAHDRLHLERSTIRRVETGHDSPWIAGQALGDDTMLLKDLEPPGVGRWRSVLTLPVPVPHPVFPSLSAGVLTVALPDQAIRYMESSMLWSDMVGKISHDWGNRISTTVFSG